MRTANRNRRLLWRGGVVLFSRPCNGAFTMVEMLAVLMILTILVALAVGVGVHVMAETKRKQTIAIQQVVIEALQAYYDNKKEYPNEEGDGTDDCSELMNALSGDADAKVLLKGLSIEAYAAGTNTALMDAYGKAMRYRKSGGLGGGPVLISAGKDKSFGDEEIESGTATSGTATTLTDTAQTWGDNDLVGNQVKITGGKGANQTRTVESNTADTLTISSAWDTEPDGIPDGTSQYEVVADPEGEGDNIRSDGKSAGQ